MVISGLTRTGCFGDVSKAVTAVVAKPPDGDHLEAHCLAIKYALLGEFRLTAIGIGIFQAGQYLLYVFIENDYLFHLTNSVKCLNKPLGRYAKSFNF